ncbi:hypothetical protein GQ53DRAFT_775862 [Thozetella sp. PMI_491]|nr:hypothetical protein GQ53DRAFT_775862 [Thozetella sp. PMI_491]
MRLINVETLDLEEFYGEEVPKYAILSHTWEDGEVTFQDWKEPSISSKKPGFAKIRGACRQYTNCIDKTSSAELTEAINSMFAWYQRAEICYNYLIDVPPIDKKDRDRLVHFRKSRWFTRGWTLQELLAPQRSVFFSQDWAKFGSRSSSLLNPISSITGIDVRFLSGTSLMNASVSEKMSWLSRRVTTRVEDIAYCALGIFDINMPLLYGEGMKAFIRLQEEIIKVSNDHTLFCWTWTNSIPRDWVSMLAPSPEAFMFSESYLARETTATPSSYSMTNAGLSIRLATAAVSTKTITL